MNAGGTDGSPAVASNYCVTGGADGPQPSAGACIQYYPTGSAGVAAAATSVLSNGLTLTFATTGSPTGTLTVYWRAKRGI
jgi:hypothetical protein